MSRVEVLSPVRLLRMSLLVGFASSSPHRCLCAAHCDGFFSSIRCLGVSRLLGGHVVGSLMVDSLDVFSFLSLLLKRQLIPEIRNFGDSLLDWVFFVGSK